MDLTSAISNLSGNYTTQVADAISSISSGSDSSSASTDDTFDAIYDAVSGVVSDTNSYIEQAQQAEVDFALGNITSTHELGVYQQQANLALQYTVAIRDKALEAYKEIMNMSI